MLYVQDSGIGIAEEEQPNVFERFYRVLGTQQEGSGLGLNIVKEIAARHQASVSLFSEGPHKGAMFSVAFLNAEPH